MSAFALPSVPYHFFFMMSGFLALSKVERAGDYGGTLKRLSRILLPLCFWTCFAVLFKGILFGNLSARGCVKGLYDALMSPAECHLWYLYSLSAFYIIVPIVAAGIRGLSVRSEIVVFAVLLLPSMQKIANLLFQAQLDFDVLAKFSFWNGDLLNALAGYFLAKTSIRVHNLLLAVGIVLCVGVVAEQTSVMSHAATAVDARLVDQHLGFMPLLAMLVFLFFKQNLNKTYFWTRSFVASGMGIYLVHLFVIYLLQRFVSLQGSVSYVMGMSMFVFIISYLIVKSLASVKPLCFLSTGVSYGTACECLNWQFTYALLKRKVVSKKKE